MRKIIIFDMDGTLVNTKKDITTSINYVRKQKSLPPLDEEIIIDAINNKSSQLAKIFYETEEFEKEDRDIFQKHYLNECSRNSFVYDGILDALSFFKSNGCKLSVATNAYTIFAEKILYDLKIKDYFDFIIGACKVKNPKPAPDMLNKILDYYQFDFASGIKPVMIGDSYTDVEAGKKANMKTIFVDWGFGKSNGKEDIMLSNTKDFQIIDFFG